MKSLIKGALRFIPISKKMRLNFKLLKFYFNQSRSFLFNKKIRIQHRDYKSIPIFIISFNQLDNLKKLIAFLWHKEYYNIVIIDNNSTYKPLLNYLSTLDNKMTIFRLKKNFGHRVFWKKKELFENYTKGYYAITDPDILPDKNCPEDFLLQFKKILDRNPQIDKVGFSLRIDRIPDYNPNKQKIINWEKKYWIKTGKAGNYIAEIDTTFALYRPGKPFISYKGIRSKYPYIASHESWNIDPMALTKEQEYYSYMANNSNSWKFDKNGRLSHNYYD